MERREFILKTGAMITTTTFLSSFGNINSLLANSANSSNAEQPDKRPDPDNFTQPVLKAIAFGINAPSPHNTQSWKFKILSDIQMELFVDENILLLATDPPSRQIHMGAGCFIETMVQGASRFGYEARVTYFPEGYSSDKDFSQKPVASISLSQTNLEEDALAKFIETRQTNRRTYKGNLISISEYNELLELTGPQHANTRLINKNFQSFFDLFYRGFEIESKTFRTNEETRNLFRFSEEERARKCDGISIPQMGYRGIMKNLAENSLDEGNKEKWHSDKSIKLSLRNVEKGIESSRGILIWYTETNEYLDWVKTGRDYVRLSHAMTSKGLFTHPYNQAIQEYDEMKEVRNRLNELLQIKDPQKIQMIVRIGRSSTPYYAYRRNIKDYIIGQLHNL